MNVNRALKEGITKFSRLAKKTHSRPKRSRIHDLRVTSRKLRTELWLLPETTKTSAIRKAQKTLKKLTDILGEERKYEIALDDASRFGKNKKLIQRRLKNSQPVVAKGLRRKKRKRYIRLFNKALDETQVIDPQLYIPRIDQLCSKLSHMENDLPKTSEEKHELRIVIKKTRYILQAFNWPETPRLRYLQDHLGRWHDLTVLAELTGPSQAIAKERRAQWRLAQKDLKPTLRKSRHLLNRLTDQLKNT